MLGACASSQPDHFYILSPQPAGAGSARSGVATQVALQVTLPSWVDRNEMVFNTAGDGVQVLDHQRWAAPLPDQVLTTLARDIERRRLDLLVSDHNAGPSTAKFKLNVNIVQISLRKESGVSLETHWRLTDAGGKTLLNSDVFSAPAPSPDAAGVAAALSTALGLLADRLAAQLPVPDPQAQ